MVEAKQYQPIVAYDEDVAFSGSSTSDVQDLSGCTLCGLYIPAGFTGTTITFECSTTQGGTFSEIIGSDGSALSYTVAAGKYAYVEPALFAGVRFLRLVSNASETATLTLALRAV